MSLVTEKAQSRTDEITRAFGKMIRDRRINLGYSINYLTRRVGLSWSTWKQIEDGGAITIHQLVKAGAALGWEIFIEVEEE